MFRFISGKLPLLRTTCSTSVTAIQSPPHALLLRDPLVRTVSSSSSTVSSSSPAEIGLSFKVSYLMDACGLSQEDAIRAAEKARIRTRERPDSVLQLLKDYGFTDTHIRNLATKLPVLLTYDPIQNLKPKLDFFCKNGFSGPSLVDMLVTNPTLLMRSLERKLVPCIDFLRAVLPSGADMVKILEKTNQSLTSEQAPNIEILRKHGVPEPVILKLLVAQPRALMRRTERFAQIVQKVKEMGGDPQSLMFAHQVGIMSYMSESTWERKMTLLRGLGWTNDQIRTAFIKEPMFMGRSEKEIQKKMDLFVSKLGWDSAFLSERPRTFKISYERKLVPRVSVLDLLISKGLLKKTSRLASVFRIPDKDFVDRYVRKYIKDIPEIEKEYNNNMKY